MASFAAAAAQFKSRLTQSNTALDAVLDVDLIHRLAVEVGHTWRRCFWRPAVVVLTFLRQVLVPDGSCRRAVVLTTLLAKTSADQSVSDDPSAYRQARQKLPRELRLFRRLIDSFQPNDVVLADRLLGT